MAIIRWQSNPGEATEFDRLRQDVSRLFNLFPPGTDPFFSRVYPAINLTERDDIYYIRAELPGVNPESLDISVVEGRLQIRGERKIDIEKQTSNYHRKEREAGFFRRTVALPGKIDPGRVAADIKNGVLTIALPKSEEAKPKKITVKTG